jgi:hypothetical protein
MRSTPRCANRTPQPCAVTVLEDRLKIEPEETSGPFDLEEAPTLVAFHRNTLGQTRYGHRSDRANLPPVARVESLPSRSSACLRPIAGATRQALDR